MRRKNTPKTILVRAPNWIGDQVLAYPFFYFLRNTYPEAEITSVCVDWVNEIQFRNLVDHVEVLTRPGFNSWREKLGVIERGARELRTRKPEGYDLSISLPNSLSSGLLLYRSGSRRRRGYSGDGRKFLLNECLPWDSKPSVHRAQAYVNLLPEEARPRRPVSEFWGVPPENDLDSWIPGELERFDYESSWKNVQFVKPPEEPYWVLAPGATAESRRWPPEYFTALARKIAADTGWRGLIVGGPKEAPLAERLCEDSSTRLRDFTAQGPASGLAQVFRNAQFTVTNESGLAHLAALCGSFVQIVCGAADPRRTQPLGPGKVQVAINPVDCWPCERNTCSLPPGQKLSCLLGIQPDMVWEEIKRGTRPKPF